MEIVVKPIGWVKGGRLEPVDDHWSAVEAEIELDANQYSAEALQGLAEFSHLLVVFHFHRVPADAIEPAARHPRGNPNWPKVGIFAQRGKNRPNRLGVSTCRLLAVDGHRLRVQGLDAIDGTPVLDLKPVLSRFEPQGPIREPAWVHELMAEYW